MSGDKYNGPMGPHPRYGNALSGKPKEVGGVIFRPYRAGIMQYTRISDDFRIEVRYNSRSGTTYRCSVDGVDLGQRFNLEINAMIKGVDTLLGKVKRRLDL